MSWMQALLDTYNNYYAAPIHNEGTILPPVGFTTKKIDIQVYLNEDGTFDYANLLDNDRRIVVPSLLEAEGRTGSTSAPYPLVDEICYVGSDLSDYTDKEYRRYAETYLTQLEQWQNTEDAPEVLRTLYTYLQKGTLVKDILKSGVITRDKNGKLPKDFPKWCVEFFLHNADDSIAKMQAVSESWKKYWISTIQDTALSYATGKIELVPKTHPKVVGNAKLISAKNADNPFQYEGRFCDAEQTCRIGYISSAKIHNTLKWLMQEQGLQRRYGKKKKQGSQQYGMYFLTWNVQCRKIKTIEDDDDDISQVAVLDTDYAFAETLNRTILGLQDAPEYQKDSTIAILGMIAATTGRMSINFWEELDGRTYLERLHHWYASCYFRLYRYDEKDKERKIYTATPTPYEIGCAVFGEDNMRTAHGDPTAGKSITKQVRRLRMDLLSCVYAQKAIPYPYVQAAYHRVLNPLRFTQKDKKTNKWSRWEWERALSITLAMQKNIRKNEEEYQLSLNTEEKDRSYLFGRLTAIADVVECLATKDENDRQTNAVRYFSAMQQRPAATWANLRSRLEPYFAKIQSPTVREYYRRMLDAVYSLGEDGTLSDNTPLTPRFLEGYHNQRYKLTNELAKKKEN